MNQHLLSSDDYEYLLLDGGFGTTLEDVFSKDISSPLWSASLVDKEEDVIVQTHLAFIEAGSDIISTATYQCSFETFNRSGYSESKAVRLMRKAVYLAAKARQQSDSARQIKIALSLGPFGASMTTAQEFTGFYPPPYGPKAFSNSASDTNTNAFNDRKEEREAQHALEEFHYRRLRVFADDSDTWARIDCIAFETVPLAREIRAIRGAMTRLLDGSSVQHRPWWISTVWPDGQFPQEKTPSGERFNVNDVVSALLDGTPDALAPDGIGINCTAIEHLGTILKDIRDNVKLIQPAFRKQFLVLYPNGGVPYDTVNHSWIGESLGAVGQTTAWAEALYTISKEEQESGVWANVVFGGCCKTGPQHIAALHRQYLMMTTVFDHPMINTHQ